MIQILGLMGMYFDTVVVEVETFLLLFRLALAILCILSLKHLVLLQSSTGGPPLVRSQLVRIPLVRIFKKLP